MIIFLQGGFFHFQLDGINSIKAIRIKYYFLNEMKEGYHLLMFKLCKKKSKIDILDSEGLLKIKAY